MEQSIKITINDKDFNLKAKNEEQEELIRVISKEINDKINAYKKSYSDKPDTYILSLVCLNKGVEFLKRIKDFEEEKKHIEEINSDLNNYLENIEN